MTWKTILQPAFETNSYQALHDFVEKEYQTKTIYPPKSMIFRAFECCPWDKVKVVILGQDPYHGAGQAHGLSFSVPEGIATPGSLRNIFKEIADNGYPFPQSTNLTYWARQGVLLLNATLTVEAGKAGSHQGKGWEQLTDYVIQQLAQQKKGLVFLLWGNFAQQKKIFIPERDHLILYAAHPSPLSAHRGFLGCGHFRKANDYLIANGHSPIDWSTPK